MHAHGDIEQMSTQMSSKVAWARTLFVVVSLLACSALFGDSFKFYSLGSAVYATFFGLLLLFFGVFGVVPALLMVLQQALVLKGKYLLALAACALVGVATHYIDTMMPFSWLNFRARVVEREVRRLYRQHKPKEQELVKTLMAAYEGKEDELLAKARALFVHGTRTRSISPQPRE